MRWLTHTNALADSYECVGLRLYQVARMVKAALKTERSNLGTQDAAFVDPGTCIHVRVCIHYIYCRYAYAYTTYTADTRMHILQIRVCFT